MKALKVFGLVMMLMALAATPALAQDGSGDVMPGLGKGLAIGLTIIGAGYGISLIGSRAVESMARQPEVAGNIQTAMIIAAALIEGATFFALLVCFMMA